VVAGVVHEAAAGGFQGLGDEGAVGAGAGGEVEDGVGRFCGEAEVAGLLDGGEGVEVRVLSRKEAREGIGGEVCGLGG